MQDFQDKVAVITGGASGIGLATARELAKAGCRLMLADIEEAALDAAVAALRGEGITAEGFVCDTSDLAAVQRLADETFSRLGAAHILFNNAGIAVHGAIAEMSHEDWKWTIDVDLWGPVHGIEAFLNRMIDQNEPGHILFTASFAGLVPNIGLGPYCVAKYGVVALAEVLARELRETGIGVSVLCPMRISTNIRWSERNRPAELGGPAAAPSVPDQSEDNRDMAGRVIAVDGVAEQVVAAIRANQLYILTHEESREPIRRRFQRIDSSFAS